VGIDGNEASYNPLAWVNSDSKAELAPATIPPGSKVKCVHESKAEFKIDFEDGSSATLCLADPGFVRCRPR
jgi:hypothetical protein